MHTIKMSLLNKDDTVWSFASIFEEGCIREEGSTLWYKGTQTTRNEDLKTKGKSDRERRNTKKIVAYRGSSLFSGSPVKRPRKACLLLCAFTCVCPSFCVLEGLISVSLAEM